MEEKEKRKRGKEGRKSTRAKAQKKQETPETEQNIQSDEKVQIQKEFETESAQVEQTTKDYEQKEPLPFPISLAINEFNKIKEKINSQVQIVKNLYSLFQGMKQMYGGDTKKVIQVIAGFAKEEAKRRINEAKNKVKEKIGLKTKES